MLKDETSQVKFEMTQIAHKEINTILDDNASYSQHHYQDHFLGLVWIIEGQM